MAELGRANRKMLMERKRYTLTPRHLRAAKGPPLVA
jgi:hypothetical protein